MNNEEYLKQLTQWAVDNPDALWADNKEAAAARDWLRKNYPKDLSSLYWVMDDEQRKKVDRRFIPTDVEQYNFNKGITDATDKVAERITPIFLGAVNPAGAMTMLGGSAVDFGIESATKGKKKNFGDLFVDSEKHPYLNAGINFLNPAYWLGGGIFSKAVASKPLTYGIATLNKARKAFRKEAYSNMNNALNINNVSKSQEALPDPIQRLFNAFQKAHHKSSTSFTHEDVEAFVDKLQNDRVQKLFSKYKNELINGDTYHPGLSPEALLEEVKRMAVEPTEYRGDLNIVQQYFSNDVLPRLLDNLKKDGIVLSDKQINYIKNLYQNPTNGIVLQYDYLPPNVGGLANKTRIVFSHRYPISSDTIAHELHHNLRRRLGEYLFYEGKYENRTLPEILLSKDPRRNNNNFLFQQYANNEVELMKPLAMDEKYRWDKTPLAEIAASLSGDGRFKAWSTLKHRLKRIPTIEEVDNYINSWSTDNTLKFLNEYTSYGRTRQIGSRARNEFNDSLLGSWLTDSEYAAKQASFNDSLAKAVKAATTGIAGIGGIWYIDNKDVQNNNTPKLKRK